MSAHAAHFSGATAPAAPSRGLAASLFAGAQSHPRRILLRDAGDRTAWNGRPAIVWTYEAATEIVGRLARGIGMWRLPPASRIGLCFGGGAEAALAHLAVEAAGHLPCLLSPVWDTGALSAAIEGVGLAAILTEGRRDTRRPAEEFTRVAIRHFGLRFIAAFGPGLPDGVISLDAMALERGVADPRPSQGVVTFAGADPLRPVHRAAESLDAAVAAHRDRLTGADRILTVLPSHDLRGLVTGLGTALSSGGQVETLIPFDGASFRAILSRPVPTRLVVPAAFEPALAEIVLPWTVRVVDVVHRAPACLPEPSARDVAGPPRLDVLVLDEDVVLTRPRGRWDIPVDDGHRRDPVPQDGRPEIVRRPGDGRLLCSGLATRAAPLQCGTTAIEASPDYRETTYRGVISGGKLMVVPAV